LPRIVAERASQRQDVLREQILGDDPARPHQRQQFVLGDDAVTVGDEDEKCVPGLR
jgi:hypothetical protein